MQRINIWGNKVTRFDEKIERLNTNSYKWDRMTDEEKERGTLPFWVADSDYKTLEEISLSLVERSKHEAYGYTICSDSYYQSVINWFKETKDVALKKEWIVPFCGVVTTLYLSIHLFTKKKDFVTINTPVYNPFYYVINKNKRGMLCNKLVEINDTYEIDFNDLEEKLSKCKMYILCNPHNPVGRSFNKEELDKIVELCKKHKVILVVDEIHSDIILDDNKFISIANYFDVYDKIIMCTAPSKTFNIAGIQCANIIIKNKAIRLKFKDLIEAMSLSSPNVFALCACESAYTYGREWVKQQNKYIAKSRDYVYSFFKERVPKAKLYKLEATYLMWINLEFLHTNSDEMVKELKEFGVWVNGGKVYGEDYSGYIRLNIACPFAQLKEGLERIEKYILEKEKKV